MFYFLSSLLSWLSGMLIILITAFFKYDQFSIIDITSFAVFTFVGFLILFLMIYFILLRTIAKKVAVSKQFIYFPFLFALLANLPAYIVIWLNTPALYGSGEATLFTIGILTSGLVFGLFWAWKNKMLSSIKRI
jgi:heme/copper-type cytochrome/quinol oxidase subunit 2